MAKKMNRKCIMCGAEYSYCPKCGKDVDKPTWMNLFNDENCNEIYTIVTQFRDGYIDKDVAVERLSKCDIGVVNNESFKKLINEINKPNKIKKVQPKIEETVVEPTEIVEEVKDEVVVEVSKQPIVEPVAVETANEVVKESVNESIKEPVKENRFSKKNNKRY